MRFKWNGSALCFEHKADSVTEFNIFVTKKDIFQSNFDDLQTSWSNENNAKDITKVKLDKTDLYFASLI